MKGLRLELAAPGPSCVGVGVMLALAVLIFLPSLSCDSGAASYFSYKKALPRNLTVGGREGPEEKMSYELLMHGQKLLVHLELKRDYFVSNFPVFTYQRGIVRREQPLMSHACHAEGYIDGVRGSFVSVNTCSGLRGILIKDEKYYSVEPREASEGLDSVLYPMVQQTRISCGGTSHTNHHQGEPGGLLQESGKLSSVQAQSPLWSHTKYVEMFIVVSHQRFEMWDSDVSTTVQKVMDIIALANSYTRAINTEVVLAGMEIWTEEDLIEVSETWQETLHSFNTWRREQLFLRAHYDVAHLIVGHDPGEDAGLAFLSGACSSEFAAAVESFHHEDILLFVAIMVHELGHNLGIWHDHAACVCQNKHFCLMQQSITKETGFSNCSSAAYFRFLQQHRGSCLFNKPQSQSRGRRQATCGNGIREGEEQCDCGKKCATSKCCKSDCNLQPGAQCGQGTCCNDDCQLQPKGYMCRADVLDCDLPEYCDGVSPECPNDFYKEDGSTCEEIYACSGGKCKSHNSQCMDLFGAPATSAPEGCYLKVNSQGNRFGNCGRAISADTVYVPCSKDSVFCGKVVCTNVYELPNIEEYYTVSSFWHESSSCWTMDAYMDTDIPDRGDVPEETFCSSNKACQGSSCSDFKPTTTCSTTQCHLHGICNNLNKCHCFTGYAPPDCTDIGGGGSEDGGSPASQEVIIPNKDPAGPQKAEDKGLSMAVLSALIFLLLLTLIIIISAMIFSRKRPVSVSPSETVFTEESEERETEKGETEETEAGETEAGETEAGEGEAEETEAGEGVAEEEA